MNILIKNAMIIDGTGSPGYKSDLRINGDLIEKIGVSLDEENCEIIDATNKVISPGFIDMHNHGDITILKVPKAEASIMQGVTTLVVGVCGLGMAPANDIVRNYYAKQVARLFSTSEMELFDTLQEFMDKITERGVAINLAFFVPQGNIRTYVLGLENRPATEGEIEKMKVLVRQGMDAGAFGLSTGLIYPPGEYTQTDELIEVCKAIKEYDGIYNSHIRNEGKEILEQGINELIEIAREAQVKAHISHLKVGGFSVKKLPPKIIDLIRSARAEGLFLHADLYPYEEVPFFITAILSPWVFENFGENLTKSETREKILDEIFAYFFEIAKSLPKIVRIIPKFIIKWLMISYIKKKIRVLRVLNNRQIEGKFLGEALRELYPEEKFLDALLDFIRDEQGFITLSYKWMDEKKSILSFFKQDFVCIGTDGFLIPEGNTHPRSYGTYPKILGDYVRERQLITLEESIRKMTGLPASILGLFNRGLIKEGYVADVVIFDPTIIKDKATYDNASQYPEGIDYVIVNGEITVQKGKHLGVLNGRILKHKKEG